MIIFALAGIIPPMDDDDVTFREILYHMRKLRRHDRYRLLRIAREWANEPVEEEEEEEPE